MVFAVGLISDLKEGNKNSSNYSTHCVPEPYKGLCNPFNKLKI